MYNELSVNRSSSVCVPRNDQYFAGMRQWNDREPYKEFANAIARAGCDMPGIDINNFQLEYPLMALVRERRPSIRFVHTAVTNPSRRYSPPVHAPPCVIACLDCVGDVERLKMYSGFRRAAAYGKFVIISKK